MLDIEIILERAREKHPGATPRIISDNGPQFISADFKSHIKLCGMTHVKTSPFYPQSNAKLERFHGTLKQACIRPQTPLCLDDAIRSVTIFVDHYNNERLHSAIGYVAPKDKLEGAEEAIFASRKRKLLDAKHCRESHQKGDQQAAVTLGEVAFADAI